MENKNQEQLQKLAKIFNTDNVITADQIKSVLTGIVAILGTYKSGTETLNSDTKKSVLRMVDQIKKEHADVLSEVKENSKTLSSKFEKLIKGLKESIVSRETIEQMSREISTAIINEKCQTEHNEIVSEVLAQIKLPENKVLTMSGGEIANQLETLTGEDRLKATAIAGLEEMIDQRIAQSMPTMYGGGGGVRQRGTIGGGVTQIKVTGAGITMTSTYGARGMGVVTLTVTGGGGGGSGDVVGPAGATDNAIARFDTTTGKLIQNSVVTIADTTGNMAGVGTINTLVLPTSNFVGLTDSQTLSNKILDEAKIINGGFIKDGNGNELLIFNTTASAVNELTFNNAATGNNPRFQATGGDSNIGIDLLAKGTGSVNIRGNSTLAGELRIYEDTGSGTNYSAFRGSTRSTDITYLMPTADPTSGQALTSGAPSGGVAQLSWTTISSGGSPGGSGSEIQYRGGASTFSAVSGSSVTANGYMTLAPTASTSGSPTLFTITAPAHTTLAASTEATDINFNLARTVQFATGTIALQRAMRIQGPTYAFVAASTITSVTTLQIDVPVAGTNATFTNSYGLVVGNPIDFINTIANFGGSLNSFYEINMTNNSSGTLASSDITAASNNATNGTNFVDMGITSSGFTDTNFTLWGGANAAYLFSEATSLTIATQRAGAPVRIGTGGTLLANLRVVISDSSVALTPGVATTGSPNALSIVGAAHTTLTASTEASDVLFNLARTVQFATGALTKQTAVNITAPTYGFVGASTISDAATLYINDAPGTGTNATITRKYALWVDSGIIRGDNEFLGGNGTNTNPTFAFVSDTNTGIYRIATARLGIGINGTGQIDVSSTYMGGLGSNDFQIRHSNGLSATVPTYAFFTSTTSGMGMSAANTLNLITNSLTAIEMDSAQKVSIGGQAPLSTLDVRGSFSVAYVAKTANYTATVSDHTIECTANTFQVTLPTAVGITGRIYVVVNSGAGTITIGTTSSQTFVNVVATPTTLTLAAVGSYRVQSNGANWMVI